MAHAQSIRILALLGVIAVAALSGGCEKGERLVGDGFENDFGNAAKIIKPGPNPEGNGNSSTGNGTGGGGGNGASSSN